MFFEPQYQNCFSLYNIFLTLVVCVPIYHLTKFVNKRFMGPRVYVYRTDDKSEFKPDNNNAGVDLRLSERIVVGAGECVKVDTTLAINIPSGMHGIIKERSSVGCQGVIMAGGVIDSGYTAVISLIMINTSRFDREFSMGERVAQIIFAKNVEYSVKFVKSTGDLPYKYRGLKGFGSTNVRPVSDHDIPVDNRPAFDSTNFPATIFPRKNQIL